MLAMSLKFMNLMTFLAAFELRKWWWQRQRQGLKKKAGEGDNIRAGAQDATHLEPQVYFF